MWNNIKYKIYYIYTLNLRSPTGGAAKGISLKAMYNDPNALLSTAPPNFPCFTVTICLLIVNQVSSTSMSSA